MVNPPKLTCTTAATTNIRIARFDSSCDNDRYHDDASSVRDLRSQRQAGSRCTLPECCAAHRDTARPNQEQRHNADRGVEKKMNSNSTCDSSPCSQSVSLTCWKMQRMGKVREMSSLICSRLDSRSDEPASETRRTKLHRGRRARSKSRSEVITSVCEQTFRFRLSGGRRRVPPLFFGSRQTDAVQLCLGHSAEAQHRQCKRHRGV